MRGELIIDLQVQAVSKNAVCENVEAERAASTANSRRHSTFARRLTPRECGSDPSEPI
jgi:hypothetical protein